MRLVRSRLRAGLLSALLVVGVPLGGLGFNYASGNVHEVEAGALYRSGQLGGAALRRLVSQEHIRTILNLRGPQPQKDWYRQEEAVARDLGVEHRSIGISAQAVPDMATLQAIAATLSDAPRPILVHCLGGSDRTGLVSAMYELVVEGRDEPTAAAQLSVLYGHFPWLGSRTSAMDRAFSLFADYWRNERRQLVASEP